MKKYLTEFIGAFFLVLTIGLSVVQGVNLAPLAIGAILMVMVYMGGHVSGAHYNPAVSLAVFMRGKMEAKELAPYFISQILGAFSASCMVYQLTGKTFALAPAATASMTSALLIELLFTFGLALVVLNVATAPATQGNSFYGLAIGFTIMGAAFVGGPVSGGAFNPAVGIGPMLLHGSVGEGSFATVWIYLVGPLAGGALAALVYKLQNPEGVE